MRLMDVAGVILGYFPKPERADWISVIVHSTCPRTNHPGRTAYVAQLYTFRAPLALAVDHRRKLPPDNSVSPHRYSSIDLGLVPMHAP